MHTPDTCEKLAEDVDAWLRATPQDPRRLPMSAFRDMVAQMSKTLTQKMPLIMAQIVFIVTGVRVESRSGHRDNAIANLLRRLA
jgi:hypothetical protein